MKAVVNKERCKSCELCMTWCPQKAITMTTEMNSHGYKHVQVSDDQCVGCGICYIVCPDGVFNILHVEEETKNG